MIVGLDLGGTVIKSGLIHDGLIVRELNRPAQSKQGLQASLKTIEGLVHNLMAHAAQSNGTVRGLGIAIPGIVDTTAMRVISTNQKYDDACAFDFVTWAQSTFHLPIVLENDARTALIGEWQFGAGQGVDDLAMMTLGTGIGTAALIEGQLLHGKHFQAGCLGGHFSIRPNGRQCTCGNRGCLEAEASSWQLSNLILQDPDYGQSSLADHDPDFKWLFACAEAGDELAIRLKEHCLTCWATGVVNLIHAYDPERVILGGGVMKSAAAILPFIQAQVEALAWTPSAPVSVVAARIPDRSALLGAYHLMSSKLLER